MNQKCSATHDNVMTSSNTIEFSMHDIKYACVVLCYVANTKSALLIDFIRNFVN